MDYLDSDVTILAQLIFITTMPSIFAITTTPRFYKVNALVFFTLATGGFVELPIAFSTKLILCVPFFERNSVAPLFLTFLFSPRWTGGCQLPPPLHQPALLQLRELPLPLLRRRQQLPCQEHLGRSQVILGCIRIRVVVHITKHCKSWRCMRGRGGKDLPFLSYDADNNCPAKSTLAGLRWSFLKSYFHKCRFLGTYFLVSFGHHCNAPNNSFFSSPPFEEVLNPVHAWFHIIGSSVVLTLAFLHVVFVFIEERCFWQWWQWWQW